MANHKIIKKWLTFGAVATALLIIPRRSSRNADSALVAEDDLKNNDSLKNDTLKYDHLKHDYLKRPYPKK